MDIPSLLNDGSLTQFNYVTSQGVIAKLQAKKISDQPRFIMYLVSYTILAIVINYKRYSVYSAVSLASLSGTFFVNNSARKRVSNSLAIAGFSFKYLAELALP